MAHSFEHSLLVEALDLNDNLLPVVKARSVSSYGNIDDSRHHPASWVWGSADDDHLAGDAGQNWIFGNGGNDEVTANDGEDRVSGGTGDDVLSGGAGTDWLTGDNGDDAVSGDDGDDWLRGAEGDDRLYGGAGIDRLNGGSGGDLLSGGDGNDWLLGGAGDDFLDGGRGDDNMYGGAGDDLFIGGVGSGNLIDGGDGIDTVDYTLGDGAAYVNLTTMEWSGDVLRNVENLIGSQYADFLEGDDNNNVLAGGAGFDVLWGYGGADTFRFDYAEHGDQEHEGQAYADSIGVFSSVEGDKIDVSPIDADRWTEGKQDFHFIGNADFSSIAGELRVIVPSNVYPRDYLHLEGDTDGDGDGDLVVRIVGDFDHHWTVNDFIL